MSDGFTDWDRLPWRTGGTNFCPACTWAFRTTELRWYAHIVTAAGRAWQAKPGDLSTALSAPLGEHTLVTVPVSMQKHLLPYARWGMVSTDNILLPWREHEACLFGAYRRLLALGFNGAAIAEPAPRWQPLSKLDPATRSQVMAWWPRLDPWRQARPYLEVAARATRRPKPDDRKEDPSDDTVGS